MAWHLDSQLRIEKTIESIGEKDRYSHELGPVGSWPGSFWHPRSSGKKGKSCLLLRPLRWVDYGPLYSRHGGEMLSVRDTSRPHQAHCRPRTRTGDCIAARWVLVLHIRFTIGGFRNTHSCQVLNYPPPLHHFCQKKTLLVQVTGTCVLYG